MSISPIPEGYHTVTPYLIVKGAAAAIEFYTTAFGATETMRLEVPGVGIMHAEIKIGNSHIMLSDEHPQMGATSPETIGGSPVSICLYVEDVDSLFKQALDAGGTEVRPLVDQFYGDRSGTLKDPYGHTWTLGSRKEDLSPEEIGKRFQKMMGQSQEE